LKREVRWEAKELAPICFNWLQMNEGGEATTPPDEKYLRGMRKE